MKKQKIEITQKDGVINIARNSEVEKTIDLNRAIKNIKDEFMDEIGLANMIAEIIHDCLNCKSAVASLKDLNDKRQYFGTYFENIDYFTD